MSNDEEVPQANPIMTEVDSGRVHPRIADTVFEAFPTEQPFAILHPADGLPVDHVEDVGDEAAAPALSPQTLVCMAQPGADGTFLPKCVHYKRQKARDTEIQIWVIQRWCLCPALRGTNGAALDLRDTAVPACELRDPPDPNSERLMDQFDEMRMEQGKNRTSFRVFKTEEDVAQGRTKIEP